MTWGVGAQRGDGSIVLLYENSVISAFTFVKDLYEVYLLILTLQDTHLKEYGRFLLNPARTTLACHSATLGL